MSRQTVRTVGILFREILARSLRRARRLDALWIVSLVWLGGVLVRFGYILRGHHPRNHVVSDAIQMTDLAKRFVDAPLSQNIGDTIWPPGTPATLALFMARDPTLAGAAILQCLLSCAVPLIVAHTAYLVAGRRVAVFALLAATCDFGLIHYGGFFLSEQLFQFAIVLAMWCTVVALSFDYAFDESGDSIGRVGRPITLGAAAGASWALATTFRPNALPVVLILGAVMVVCWIRRRSWRSLWVLCGAGLSFFLLMTPVATRCTRLRGQFCPVSTNFAMNVALGQLEGDWGIEFADPKRPDLTTSWVPPIMIDHGYRGMIRVPYSIYDTNHIISWVWDRFIAEPGPFAMRCVRNMLDLFRFDYWPHDFTSIREIAANAWTQGFGLLVLAPGLIGLCVTLRRLAERGRDAPGELASCCVLLSVMAISALSLGDPRYRTPFDGVIILLAGIGFFGVERPALTSRSAPGRRLFGAVIIAGVVAITWVGLIAVASSPSWGLAKKFRLSGSEGPTVEVDERNAGGFDRPATPHGSWDAQTNYKFRCEPTCREVRLRFDRLQVGRHVELSVDSNDRYRVSFYRGSMRLGVVDLMHDGGPGMRVDVLAVPEGAIGYDAVGVLPLYGDGAYALGHLRVLP